MTVAAVMPVENHLAMFQRALRNIVVHDPLGPGVSAELLVARMLAAVRLWPQGDAMVPGFLNRAIEFTSADWQALLHRMAGRWREERTERFNPFEDGLESERLRPGTIENFRRIVLSSLDRAGQVSPELIEATLDLPLRSRFGPVARLAPEWEEVVVDLVDPRSAGRVFCGFENASGIALKLAIKGAGVRLDIQNYDTAAVCACLALAGDADLVVKLGDPMDIAVSDLGSEPTPFDTAIVVPPIGVRLQPGQGGPDMTGLLPYSSSENGGVALAIARARHRAICVVPPSFLFKATRADQHFKEVVAREFGLETIVGLPRGVYPNASIMAALLLFDLDRGGPTEIRQVFVVDAVDRDHTNAAALPTNDLPQLLRKREVGDISVMVSIAELAANDFNLSPDRYVVAPEVLRLRQLAEDAETVALGDLVEIYRPQALAGSKAAAEGNIVAFEIGVADIDEVGLVETPGKRLALSEAAASQARKAVIEPGDVLLVIKGSVGKVGYIRSIPKEALWLASQSFAVLRLRRHAPISDPRVLFRFLSSGLGQASLQNFRVGSTVPGLQMSDVRRLPVVLPDGNAHAAIARQVDGLFAIQDHIRQLRSDLIDRQTTIWPDGSAPSGTCADEAKGNQHRI